MITITEEDLKELQELIFQQKMTDMRRRIEELMNQDDD